MACIKMITSETKLQTFYDAKEYRRIWEFYIDNSWKIIVVFQNSNQFQEEDHIGNN